MEQDNRTVAREVSEIILSYLSFACDDTGSPHPRDDAPLPDTTLGETAGDAPTRTLRSGLTAVAEYQQPIFYIRPPTRQPQTAPTTSTSVLFVCMIHRELLNEEALNTYFGRYGQVGATLHTRRRIRETALLPLTRGVNSIPALRHPRRSASPLDAQSGTTPSATSYASHMNAGTWWLQTFLVTVDSAANAELAVTRAFYRELLFIARHDEAHNSMTMNDVESLFVYDVGHVAQLVAPSMAGMYRLAATGSWRKRGRRGRRSSSSARQNRHEESEDRHSKENVGEKSSNDEKEENESEEEEEEERDGEASNGEGVYHQHGLDRRSDTHDSRRRRREEYDENEEDKEKEKDGEEEEEVWWGDDGGGSGSSSSSSTQPRSRSRSSHRSDRVPALDFTPDVVIDGFPFWVSEEEVWAFAESYGPVRSVHLAIDDLSGAFVGTVMVCMQSLEAAVQLCTEVHGSEYKGYTLYCGALTSDLELVDVMTGEVRVAGLESEETKGLDILQNTPLWV